MHSKSARSQLDENKAFFAITLAVPVKTRSRNLCTNIVRVVSFPVIRCC